MGRRGRGEGSIYYKESEKRWVCQITVGYEDGKQKRKAFYGKTQKEVQQKLHDFKEQYKNRKYNARDQNKVLSEWMLFWLDNYTSHLSPSTYDDYESKVKLHINKGLGKIKVNELRPSDIQQFYNQKSRSGRADGNEGGLTSRTIKYIHVVLRAALEQAKLEGLITINPADTVKIPKSNIAKNDRFILTQEEQDRFLDIVQDDRLFPLFAFAILTGCRQGEILAMQWKRNINFDNKSILVSQSVSTVKDRSDSGKKTKTIITEPKTASSIRTIPMCHELYVILLKHKEVQNIEKENLKELYNDNDYVFSTLDGKMLNYRNVIRKFHQLLEKASVPRINFHSLRHLFASRLIQNNVSMKIVQEYLGHASYNLTANTYSHVTSEIKRAEIEQLNTIFTGLPSRREFCTDSN